MADNPPSPKSPKKSTIPGTTYQATASSDCKACDLTFATARDLTFHKILSDAHIACRYCGLEFDSEEGKEAHEGGIHNKESTIPCFGCTKTFTRAAGYIEHYAQNRCRGDIQTRKAPSSKEQVDTKTPNSPRKTTPTKPLQPSPSNLSKHKSSPSIDRKPVPPAHLISPKKSGKDDYEDAPPLSSNGATEAQKQKYIDDLLSGLDERLAALPPDTPAEAYTKEWGFEQFKKEFKGLSIVKKPAAAVASPPAPLVPRKTSAQQRAAVVSPLKRKGNQGQARKTSGNSSASASTCGPPNASRAGKEEPKWLDPYTTKEDPYAFPPKGSLSELDPDVFAPASLDDDESGSPPLGAAQAAHKPGNPQTVNTLTADIAPPPPLHLSQPKPSPSPWSSRLGHPPSGPAPRYPPPPTPRSYSDYVPVKPSSLRGMGLPRSGPDLSTIPREQIPSSPAGARNLTYAARSNSVPTNPHNIAGRDAALMPPPPPPPVWGGGGLKKKADADIGDGRTAEQAAHRKSTANPLLAHQQILAEAGAKLARAAHDKAILDHLGPAALRAAQISGHAPVCSPSGTHLGAFTNGRYHHAFDPDAPAFAVETHVDSRTNRYKCPWPGCGRDFPSAAGLLGHLRAPAHNQQRFSCPFCGRSFAGGAALGGHLEQEGYTCGGVQDHRARNAMGDAGGVGGAGDNGEKKEEKRSTWMGRKR